MDKVLIVCYFGDTTQWIGILHLFNFSCSPIFTPFSFVEDLVQQGDQIDDLLGYGLRSSLIQYGPYRRPYFAEKDYVSLSKELWMKKFQQICKSIEQNFVLVPMVPASSPHYLCSFWNQLSRELFQNRIQFLFEELAILSATNFPLEKDILYLVCHGGWTRLRMTVFTIVPSYREILPWEIVPIWINECDFGGYYFDRTCFLGNRERSSSIVSRYAWNFYRWRTCQQSKYLRDPINLHAIFPECKEKIPSTWSLSSAPLLIEEYKKINSILNDWSRLCTQKTGIKWQDIPYKILYGSLWQYYPYIPSLPQDQEGQKLVIYTNPLEILTGLLSRIREPFPGILPYHLYLAFLNLNHRWEYTPVFPARSLLPLKSKPIQLYPSFPDQRSIEFLLVQVPLEVSNVQELSIAPWVFPHHTFLLSFDPELTRSYEFLIEFWVNSQTEVSISLVDRNEQNGKTILVFRQQEIPLPIDRLKLPSFSEDFLTF